MAGLTASVPLLGYTGVGLPPVFEDEIVETLGLSLAELIATRAFPLVLTESLIFSGASVPAYGQVITENLRLTEIQIQNLTYHLTATENLDLTEQLVWGWAQIAVETLGLHDSPVAQQAVTVIESLNLQPVLAAAAIYQKTVLETLHITDALLRFFGGEIVETINFTEDVSRTAAFGPTITETLGLAETYAPLWVLRAIVTDELNFSDDQILNMIFQQEVVEGLEFSAAYLSPGGSVTTWAMNTRTAAVTEYTNYNFNSFAQLGNTYFGASETGLYELLGDDDDGANIISTIKSGFAQWGGSKFMRFKGIYMGVRGEGGFVLKLITGDDKTYNYAVSPRNQRTTKVHLGKGLKARYWAFELISTGQDFDLDTIEFVPLVTDRRV